MIWLPARGRTIDGGYIIRLGARQRVSHTEFHRKHQSLRELGLDVAEAQVRLNRREGQLVLSQVWDLYGSRRGPVLEERELPIGVAQSSSRRASRCVYRRVNLRGMKAEELLAQASVMLWPLVPLTRDGARERAVLRAREAIAGRTDLGRERQADCLAALLFLAEAEDVALGLLREYITEEILMQSTLYQEILNKGKADGAARTQATDLIKMLVRRFGVVDEALNQRICAETRRDLLEEWFDQALVVPDRLALMPLLERIRLTPPPVAQ